MRVEVPKEKEKRPCRVVSIMQKCECLSESLMLMLCYLQLFVKGVGGSGNYRKDV